MAGLPTPVIWKFIQSCEELLKFNGTIQFKLNVYKWCLNKDSYK